MSDAVTTFGVEQRRVMAAVLAAADRIWGSRPPQDFDAWFARNVDDLVGVVTIGQSAAIAPVAAYVAATLDELGDTAPLIAEPDPSPLIGVASDGRPLDSLAYGAVIRTRARIAAADTVDDQVVSAAWDAGRKAMLLRVQTQLSDASRVATGLHVVARPRALYVRTLNRPSCSRCVVLAGRTYRWSEPFKRHPGCDCRMRLVTESVADVATIDPESYFRSLGTAEQDRVFTRAGAEAIRSGADIGQVVNARRGAAGLDATSGPIGRLRPTVVGGQSVFVTTEGTTRRGIAGKAMRAAGRDPKTSPRLMPETIFEIATSRADAIRLLQANGYMAGRPGPVQLDALTAVTP